MKKKLAGWIKQYKWLDRAVWRVRHPFGGDRIALLEEQTKVQTQQIDWLQNILRAQGSFHWKQRAIQKQTNQIPIRVVFVCHEPALWPMFETIYESMIKDSSFDPLVVAMPVTKAVRSVTADMYQFCQERQIQVLKGYDTKANQWLNPLELEADYLFLQTPYSLFPPMWQVEALAVHTKICYIPYATIIFEGAVDAITHPLSFFQNIHLFFLEGPIFKERFLQRFSSAVRLNPNSIKLSGSPKLSWIRSANSSEEKSGLAKSKQQNGKCILWTPRWRTEEEICHFFEHYPFFVEFCRQHPDIRFIFRPHPLMFHNFQATGEFSAEQLDDLKKQFQASPNMALDLSPDYRESFQAADMLVTDVSSFVWEFMSLNKPIVYTHRTHVFNEIGDRLAQGCYWASNINELETQLGILIKGIDDLVVKRQNLVRELYFHPKEGPEEFIKNALKEDVAAQDSIITSRYYCAP